MNEVGNRIKFYRLQAGLTLLEVANKLGVKEATVQRYESGTIKNLKYDTISELARIFGVKPGQLLGWEEDTRFDEYVSLLEQMTPEDQKHLLEYMKFILKKQSK